MALLLDGGGDRGNGLQHLRVVALLHALEHGLRHVEAAIVAVHWCWLVLISVRRRIARRRETGLSWTEADIVDGQLGRHLRVLAVSSIEVERSVAIVIGIVHNGVESTQAFSSSRTSAACVV